MTAIAKLPPFIDQFVFVAKFEKIWFITRFKFLWLGQYTKFGEGRVEVSLSTDVHVMNDMFYCHIYLKEIH